MAAFTPSAKVKNGFTLVELLIALLIIGEIAAFTIPKIINSQQNTSYRAKAKEAAAMLSVAYQTHLLEGQLSASTKATDLTQYMNYIAVQTTSSVDNSYNNGTWSCATYMCLQLHNGGVLAMSTTNSFGGTNATNNLYFKFDPDGKVTDGTTNGPGKAVPFYLLYNGRLVTYDDMVGIQTCNNGSCVTPTGANNNPPWFSW